MKIHKSHIKLRKLENQQPNIYQGNRIKKKEISKLYTEQSINKKACIRRKAYS